VRATMPTKVAALPYLDLVASLDSTLAICVDGGGGYLQLRPIASRAALRPGLTMFWSGRGGCV